MNTSWPEPRARQCARGRICVCVHAGVVVPRGGLWSPRWWRPLRCLAGFGRGTWRISLSVKTESRDRKQKEAAAAFVVAEECGNVEALCQTFLKWGQVTFSQRGKATTTTKKVDGAGDGGEARLLPFLSAGADSPGSEGGEPGRAVRGPAGAAGAAPCGGGTSPPLPSPPGGGQDWGWEGACGRGRAAPLAAAPPLPVWPSAWLRPLFLGSGGSFLGPLTQDWPSPFKENFEWRECEGPGALRGPLRPQTARVAQSVSLIPGGRRASQRLRGR